MDHKIREAQKNILSIFAKEARTFALAGGTALEMYYLHHRFSWDLDFFSPRYDESEIERLLSAIRKKTGRAPKLESELSAGGLARVRFYTLPVRGSGRPLKIDFVQDVLIEKPTIVRKQGVRVYSVDNIYIQKIAAIAGVRPDIDSVGRPVLQGRNEARDVYDLYRLSADIRPLHLVLKTVPPVWQKGLVHWCRTFSRYDLKLSVLDLEIYEKPVDSRRLINHLESEIQTHMDEVLAE